VSGVFTTDEPVLSFLSVGALGAGFFEASLLHGLDQRIDFIGADAGSTDGGPKALSGGNANFSRSACKRDLQLLLLAARSVDVPFIVGSSGTSGCDEKVDDFADIVREIAAEQGLSFTLARIYTEIDREVVLEAFESGRIEPLSPAPHYDAEVIMRSRRITGVLGAEPIQAALEAGADVVLCGRATDTAVFAAVPLLRGVAPALAWHAGKIAECGSSSAEPRTRLDVVRIDMFDDSFIVQPLRDAVRCTPFSVSALQLHEVHDPFTMVEPGVRCDLSDVHYDAVNERAVRVSGATAVAIPYTVKLEGVESAGFQRMILFSVRDPTILEDLDTWTAFIEEDIAGRVGEILDPDAYASATVTARIYGRDGTMGAREPIKRFEGHEAAIAVDVLAPTQELCEVVMDVVAYAYMHAKSPGWRGGTSMAYPFPQHMFDLGEVFRFNVHHVIRTDDPLELFRLEHEQIGTPS
jgi:hypothetical protein